MAHDIYAAIGDGEREAYYELGMRDAIDSDEYPYERPPAKGVKSLRGHEHVPKHVRGLIWQDHSPEQALVWSEAISAVVTERMRKDADAWGEEDLRPLLDISTWLEYWGRRGVGVDGGP